MSRGAQGGPPGPGSADSAAEFFEHAPCGLLSTRLDGTIVAVNATLLGMTGYRREELLGRKRFVDLLTAGGRIYHETHYAPLLRMQDRVREIALDLACADGRWLPVLLGSVLVRDDAGQPVLVRTAVFEATDRRRYERELLGARRRAEQSESRARLLAATLQASLMPPSLPEVAGLDLAAVYRPAGHGNQVGGDFYDVFEVAGGDWGIVLGDVSGKGPEAAAVTALVRYTTRAAALRLHRPERVLDAVNEALLRHRSDRFCTAAYGILHAPGDGPCRLTVASAGHPLPLLLPAGGVPRTIGEPGSLLGVLAELDVRSSRTLLSPGDAVLLYTDGLTEARSDGEQLGEERLAGMLAGLRGASARDVAEGVVAQALDFQGGTAGDDIAALVVRVPEASRPA